MISVIICTRNRFDDFKNTLSTLVIQSRLPDEFIIIDSSDVLQIEPYLKSIQLPFSTRYFHTEPGLTLQRNRGISESKGDLLLFFDDDVSLDNNYLYQVEKIFIQDNQHKIGAVGGKIESNHNHQTQSSRLQFKQNLFKLIRSTFGLVNVGNGKFHWSGMPSHSRSSLPSGFIECLSGCCMAFRREVFEKIAFDESLARYGLMEDVDISKQILDIGYKIYYQSSALLVHNESPENRLNIEQWAEMSVVNYDYLFRKNWSKDKWRWLFYYWAMLGLIVVNLHNLKGLQGTFSGLKKVFVK